MFRKIKTHIAKKDGGTNTPQYEGPIQKRINLLYSMHDVTQELINGVRDITRSFDDEENKKRNIYESFATGTKILSLHVKKNDAEYSQFLDTVQKIYDDIGRAQHNCRTSMEDRVCMPLEAWVRSDFARIEIEIERLHSLKRLVDKPNAQQPIETANNMKAFERQMEVIKHELLKLSQIKQDHGEKAASVTDVLRIYFNDVTKAIEKQGADKWTAEGLAAFKVSTVNKNIAIGSGMSAGSSNVNNPKEKPVTEQTKDSNETVNDNKNEGSDKQYENI